MLHSLRRLPFGGSRGVSGSNEQGSFGPEGPKATLPWDIAMYFDVRDVHFTDRPDVTDKALAALALRNEDISSLIISNCPNITADGVYEVVSRAKHLTSLSLAGCASMFSNWKALPHEDASEYRRRLHSEELLVKSIALHVSLKVLDLSGCSFLCADAVRIIAENRTITALYLRDVLSVTDLEVAAIAQNPHLETLALDGCTSVRDASISALQSSHVRSLSLRQCTSLTSISAGLLGRMAKVAHLSLAGCIGIQANFHTFEGHNCLQSLDVSHCAVSDTELSILATVKQLRMLVLDGCTNLSDAGLRELVALPCLTSLSVAKCPNVTMLSWLRQLSCLTELNVALDSQLPDSELKIIPELLHSLRSLDVSDCTLLSGKTVVAIASLDSLESLYVRGCRLVGDDAVHALVRCSSLSAIDLSGTAVSPSCLSRLDFFGAELNSAVVIAVAKVCSGQLDLSHSSGVRDSTIKAIAEAPLISLNLRGCRNITDRAARLLCRSTMLESVDFSDCGLSAASFRLMLDCPLPSVAVALAAVCESLDLTAVPVSDELLSELASFNCLKALNLTDCPVANHQVAILSQSKSLRRLVLTRTMISAQVIKVILCFLNAGSMQSSTKRPGSVSRLSLSTGDAKTSPNSAVVSACVFEVGSVDLGCPRASSSSFAVEDDTAVKSFRPDLVQQSLLRTVCSSRGLLSLCLSGCSHLSSMVLETELLLATSLSFLNLSDCQQLTGACVTKLVESLPLRVLDIRWCREVDSAALSSLACSNNLERVYLSGIGALGGGVEKDRTVFDQAAGAKFNPRVLWAVVNSSLGLHLREQEAITSSVIQQLACNANLVVVDLMDCKQVDNAAVRALARNFSISMLNLHGTSVTDEVFRGVRDEFLNLEVASAVLNVTLGLNLGESMLRNEFVVGIAGSLKLMRLGLAHCPSVTNLCMRALLKSSVLKTVQLQGTAVTSSAPAEAGCATCVPLLVEIGIVAGSLDLSRCLEVDDEVLRHVAALPLCSLILNGCEKVSDFGVEIICGAHGCLPKGASCQLVRSLHSLSLQGLPRLSDHAVSVVKNGMKALSFLDCSGCLGLTNETLYDLTDNSGSIERFVVVDCDSEKLSRDAFRGRMPVGRPGTLVLPSSTLSALHSSLGTEKAPAEDDVRTSFSPLVIQSLAEALFEVDLSHSSFVRFRSLQSLTHCVWLECVNVRGCQFVDDDCIDVIATMDNLESLDVSLCSNVGAREDSMPSLLQRCTRLKKLALCGCWRLGDAVLRAAALHPALEFLDIGRCGHTMEGCLQLAQQRNLQTLGLSGSSGVTEAVIQALAGLPQFSSLDLSQTDVGAPEILAAFALPHLTTLSLSGCTMLDDECIAKVRTDSKVISLCVSCTRIGSDGFRFLASKLHVSDLDVAACTGIADFRVLRTQSCTLYRVDLSGCVSVTQADFDSFPRNPRLLEVVTVGCPLLPKSWAEVEGPHSKGYAELISTRKVQESAIRVGKQRHRTQFRFQRNLEAEIKARWRNEREEGQLARTEERVVAVNDLGSVDHSTSSGDVATSVSHPGGFDRFLQKEESGVQQGFSQRRQADFASVRSPVGLALSEVDKKEREIKEARLARAREVLRDKRRAEGGAGSALSKPEVAQEKRRVPPPVPSRRQSLILSSSPLAGTPNGRPKSPHGLELRGLEVKSGTSSVSGGHVVSVAPRRLDSPACSGSAHVPESSTAVVGSVVAIRRTSTSSRPLVSADEADDMEGLMQRLRRRSDAFAIGRTAASPSDRS